MKNPCGNSRKGKGSRRGSTEAEATVVLILLMDGVGVGRGVGRGVEVGARVGVGIGVGTEVGVAVGIGTDVGVGSWLIAISSSEDIAGYFVGVSNCKSLGELNNSKTRASTVASIAI